MVKSKYDQNIDLCEWQYYIKLDKLKRYQPVYGVRRIKYRKQITNGQQFHLQFKLQEPLRVWPCSICKKNIIKMTIFLDQKCQKMYCLLCFMKSFPGERYYILKKDFLESKIPKIGSITNAIEIYLMLMRNQVERQLIDEDSEYYSLNKRSFQSQKMSLLKKDKEKKVCILQQESSQFPASSSVKKQYTHDIYGLRKEQALKQLSYNKKRQEFRYLPPNVYEIILSEHESEDKEQTKILLEAYLAQKKVRDDAEKYILESDFLIKKNKVTFSNPSKCNQKKRLIREGILESKEIQSHSKSIIQIVEELSILDQLKNEILDPNHAIQRKAQKYSELNIDKDSLRSSKK